MNKAMAMNLRKGRYVNVKTPVMECTGIVHRVEEKRVWIKLLPVTGGEMLIWVSKDTLQGPSMRSSKRCHQMDFVVTQI